VGEKREASPKFREAAAAGPATIRSVKRLRSTAFDVVRRVGLTLPGVQAATRYDGSPVLKVDGVFMAGLATHSSAEPDTLVIRADLEERDAFIEDAPDTYYLTEAYRRYPLVLVRLPRVTRDVLRELLSSSHRLTLPKTRLRQRRGRADRARAEAPDHSVRKAASGSARLARRAGR
jgi:hypothetical protein